MGSRRSVAVAVLMMGVLAGCAHVAPSALHRTISGGLGFVTTPRNRTGGALISLAVANTDNIFVMPGVRVYDLMYRSRGLRCQGYLDVPDGKGAHPLLVVLHGGYVFPVPGHDPDGAVPANAAEAAIMAQATTAVFYPLYGGYGDSQGSSGDAYDDFVDAMNGLRALTHIEGLHLVPTTYIVGYSLGGAIGGMMIDRDPHVQAAAFVSPWPGAIVAAKWIGTHQADIADGREFYRYLVHHEGPNLNSKWYVQNSFDYDAVHIPVLLIGGQSDPIIPPGLLRTMYLQLHSTDPKVTMNLVPGGHVPINASGAVMEDWFSKLGVQLAL